MTQAISQKRTPFARQVAKVVSEAHLKQLSLPPLLSHACLKAFYPGLQIQEGPWKGSLPSGERIELTKDEWLLQAANGQAEKSPAFPFFQAGDKGTEKRSFVLSPLHCVWIKPGDLSYLLQTLESQKPEERDAQGRLYSWIAPPKGKSGGAPLHARPEAQALLVQLSENDPPQSPSKPALKAHLHKLSQLANSPIPELQEYESKLYAQGFVAGKVLFEAHGGAKLIKLISCPNADLAERLATLCHEFAHVMVGSSKHDIGMKKAMVELAKKAYGESSFSYCEKAAKELPMAGLDMWLALSIRHALKGLPPPFPKPIQDDLLPNIMGKIRKLRQLAEDQKGTPEGIQATSTANELILSYQLGDYQSSFSSHAKTKVYDRIFELKDRSIWRRNLAHAIAAYFDVFCLITPRLKRVHLFGYQEDLLAAEYLFSVSERRIEKACFEHLERWKKTCVQPSGAKTLKEKNDFSMNASVYFAEKLRAEKELSPTFQQRLKEAERVAEKEHQRRGRRWRSARSNRYRPNSAGEALGRSMDILHALTKDKAKLVLPAP